MRLTPPIGIALFVALLVAGYPARAQDERFDIRRFVVEGNTLLSEARVQSLVAPFAGPQRVYGHIQKALEALEGAYRDAGYGTVQVYVPEQELTDGQVRLEVSEGVVGRILINGIKHYDEENIRRTLPNLEVGKAPNMRRVSENIMLANDNPAKQIEVVLGVGDTEGTVDAKVNVTEEGDPVKYILSFDNTGNEATGTYRVSYAYQNANLFNADHVATLAYTTSPNSPIGVKVDVFSFAYRLPFYGIGDSVDIMYGKSSTTTPIAQATGFNLAGKGDVFGIRWNHYFPRQGEYTSRLIFGFDQKYINTTCTTNGVPTAIDPPDGGGASCTPYTVRPLSVTYAGQKASPGVMLDYSFGASRNLFPIGSFYNYTSLGGAKGNDRYTMISGGRQVPNRFVTYKAAFSWLQVFPDEWAVRAAVNAQYSPSPLPGAEQIGLAGSTAVRGFNERAVAMDKGYFANVEVYTPELAPKIGLPGSLKLVGFYDFARGFNYGTVRPLPETTPVQKAGIGSLGIGVRYTLAKDFSFRADLARVMDAGPVNIKPGTISTTPPNTESRGDWRGHFSLSLVF